MILSKLKQKAHKKLVYTLWLRKWGALIQPRVYFVCEAIFLALRHLHIWVKISFVRKMKFKQEEKNNFTRVVNLACENVKWNENQIVVEHKSAEWPSKKRISLSFESHLIMNSHSYELWNSTSAANSWCAKFDEKILFQFEMKSNRNAIAI